MESVEQAAETVISNVLAEAFDEVGGESKHRWALVVVALVLGSMATFVVIRLRARNASEPATGLEGSAEPEQS